MEGRFLLDVVIGQCPSILQLLPGKYEPLLVGWNSFFVLDFGFHVVDGVRGLDIQSDGFAGQGFHEDLHAPTKAEYQMES